jgi:hypothetical protein
MTKLTPRCVDLLRLLRGARWLTTSQVRTRFFPHASADAVRKRLRKLTAAGFLRMVQRDRLSDALFTLDRKGKQALENSGGPEVVLERQPPQQLEHFVSINDIRIAAELAGDLSYFFACHELPGLGWADAIIPDAVFTMRGKTVAVEFDRGLEGVRFFVRTKVPMYRSGIGGLPISAVIIVTESDARLRSLAQAVGATRIPFLYTTLGLIRQHGFLAPIFVREPGGDLMGLFGNSLLNLSCRGESSRRTSPLP